MKKFEIACLGLILMGLFFKRMHWPYNGEIMTLGAVLLSMLYFNFSFAFLNQIKFRNILKQESYKGISNLRINGAIATGFVFSFITIYSLFKLMLWSYAQIALEISIKLFAILVVVLLGFHFVKNRSFFLKMNYIRFISIGIIGTTLCFVTNDQLIDLYYGSDPEYAEAYKAYINDSSPNAKYPTRAFQSKD